MKADKQLQEAVGQHCTGIEDACKGRFCLREGLSQGSVLLQAAADPQCK